MDNSVLNKAFLTIWTSPRQTIRSILDSGNTKYIYMLAMVAGITNSLDRASGSSAGDDTSLWLILLLAFILGPIGGIITLHIGAFLIRWTGNWIGGAGDKSDIKVAYAWTNVPAIIGLILWILQLLLFGDEMFTTEMDRVDSNTSLYVLFFVIAAIEMVLMVWGIIILIKGIAEAQRFSSWKAIGNLLLSALVVLVPIILFVLLIIMITS